MEIPDELRDKDLIFHFTKSKAAIEHLLFEGKLRFSPMDEMNDPYEYKMVSTGVMSWGPDPLDENDVNEAIMLLKNTILKDSKIACFVVLSNEESGLFELPFTRPRLWAQYGEEQYGACFAFNKTDLFNNITKEINEIDIYDNHVIYDLGAKTHSQKNHIRFDKKLSPEENVHSHIKNYCKDIFFRKYKDFADENEYRIVLVDRSKERRQYLFCPFKGALKSVILGDRFHDVYHGLVKEHCQSHSAKAFILKYGRYPYINKL